MKYIATLNGKKYEVEIEKVNDYEPLTHEQVAELKPNQGTVKVKKADEVPVSISAGGEGTKVVSPVPGSIYDIQVVEGQTVTKGQVVLILEAMKMENEIVTAVDGIVTSVLVKKDDMVGRNDTLVIIK